MWGELGLNYDILLMESLCCQDMTLIVFEGSLKRAFAQGPLASIVTEILVNLICVLGLIWVT